MSRPHRVFLSQEALDLWVSEDRVRLEGDVIAFQGSERRLRLKPAVRFMSEVTGAGDAHSLLDHVKDLEQLAALSAEHSPGSVIVGENAYEVADGFLGEPLREHFHGDNLSAAARAATGEHRSVSDAELLAKLFLSSSRKEPKEP